MKRRLAPVLFPSLAVSLLAAALPLAAATAKGKSGTTQPTPPAQTTQSTQGVGVTSGTGTASTLPPGAKPAEIEDMRILMGQGGSDPWEMERLGVAAARAGELERARDYFRKSWETGQLPTAPFNLACIDARQGKADSAIKELQRAISVGFDDEGLLKSDTDLQSVRGKPAFASILEGARRNRDAGDAAVVKEGVFVAPKVPARAILVLLHEAPGDPVAVSSPFLGEAAARGLFVAAPRGPSRSGNKRFGWGDAGRSLSAVQAAVTEARRRAGSLPLVVVGVGRGGTIAMVAAAKLQGVVGAATAGGPLDQGMSSTAQALASLKGKRVFSGVCREAPPALVDAMRKGNEAMRAAGVNPGFAEWPGSTTGLPSDPTSAVRQILEALAK